LEPSFLTPYRKYIFIAFAIAGVVVTYGSQRALNSNTNDASDWLPEQFEETKQLAQFGNDFGTDEFIMVSWPGCTLTSEELPRFVAELRDDPDPENPIFGKVTSGQEVLAELQASKLQASRREAIARLSGIMVGKDGETTCVVLTPGVPTSAGRADAVNRIRECASAVKGLDAEEVRVAGISVDSVAIDRASSDQLFVLSASCVTISVLLLLISFRNLPLALMSFACAMFNQQLASALVFFTGDHMDSVLLMAPSLVFVLSISAAVHLVNYYRHSIEEHGHKSASRRAVADGWAPCILATITTMLGLGSLLSSYLNPIRKFGLFSALGLLCGTLALFLILPALWEQFPPRAWAKKVRQKAESRGQVPRFQHLLNFIHHARWPLTVASLALLVWSCWGVTKTTPSVALHNMFEPDARIIQDYAWIEENVGPLIPVHVVLEFPKVAEEDRASYATPTSDRLRLVQETRLALLNVEGVDASLSAVNFSPIVPMVKPRGLQLQQRARQAAVEKNLDKNRANLVQLGFLSETESTEKWRISGHVSASSSPDYQRILHDIEQNVRPVVERGERNFPGVSASYTGGIPLVEKAQQQLLVDLLNSFLLAFGFIAIAMTGMLLFLSRDEFPLTQGRQRLKLIAKCVAGGLISMIPNVLPCVLVFGAMGWWGVQVEVGTMMTATAAMGIAVDDTLHFITWFRRGLQQGKEPKEAVRFAYQRCAAAMVQTSFVCGLGLLVFGFSEFGPMKRFGWMMSCMLFAALLADLITLPALLMGPLGRAFSPTAPNRKKKAARSKPKRRNEAVA